MRYLLLLVITLLISCTNPANKSITDELSLKELKKVVSKDSTFKKTYELVKEKKDSTYNSNLELLEWSELTYNRVHEFIVFLNDTSQTNPIDRELTKAWEKKYASARRRIDSTSNYWKNYLEENTLDEYVKIELVEIDKEYYRYTSGLRQVSLGFKLTPLKGKIDQVIFSYDLEPKINESEVKSKSSLLGDYNRSRCLMSRPFSKPTVKYWKAGYDDEDILEDRSVQTLLRDYTIGLRVDEIRINGENVSYNKSDVPTEVSVYWDYEDYEYLSEDGRRIIAKDLLGIDYKSKYKFIEEGIDSILTNKDELSYRFLLGKISQ